MSLVVCLISIGMAGRFLSPNSALAGGSTSHPISSAASSGPAKACVIATTFDHFVFPADHGRVQGPKGAIAIPVAATDIETFAAMELQLLLSNLTGLAFEIRHINDLSDLTPGEAALVVGKSLAPAAIQSKLSGPTACAGKACSPRAFAVVAGDANVCDQRGKLFLMGGDLMRAVYRTLEVFGVSFFGPGDEGVSYANLTASRNRVRTDVAELASLVVEPAVKAAVIAPWDVWGDDPYNKMPVTTAYPASILSLIDTQAKLYNERLGDSSFSVDPNVATFFTGSHTYRDYFVNPTDSNTELFTVGATAPGACWQVNVMNPDAASVIGAHLLQDYRCKVGLDSDQICGPRAIIYRPENVRFRVSPQDVCPLTCANIPVAWRDQCNALVSKENVMRAGAGITTPADSSILVAHFANRVRAYLNSKGFPAVVQTPFLAYADYSEPPLSEPLMPGVVPEITFWTAAASFNNDHSKPLFGTSANQRFQTLFNRWVSLKDTAGNPIHIGIHPYYSLYSLPQLAERTQLAKDLRYLLKDGPAAKQVDYIFNQTTANYGVNFPTFSALAKFSIQPDADGSADCQRLMERSFDPMVSVPLKACFDALQDRIDSLPYWIGGNYYAELPRVFPVNSSGASVICGASLLQAKTALAGSLDEHGHCLDFNRHNYGNCKRAQLVLDSFDRVSSYSSVVTTLQSGVALQPTAMANLVLTLKGLIDFFHSADGRLEFRSSEFDPSELMRPLTFNPRVLPRGINQVSEVMRLGGTIQAKVLREGGSVGEWGFNVAPGHTISVTYPFAVTSVDAINSLYFDIATSPSPGFTKTYELVDFSGKAPSLSLDAVAVPSPIYGSAYGVRLEITKSRYSSIANVPGSLPAIKVTQTAPNSGSSNYIAVHGWQVSSNIGLTVSNGMVDVFSGLHAGNVRLWKRDPQTGELAYEEYANSSDPETKRLLASVKFFPTASPLGSTDLRLVSAGSYNGKDALWFQRISSGEVVLGQLGTGSECGSSGTGDKNSINACVLGLTAPTAYPTLNGWEFLGVRPSGDHQYNLLFRDRSKNEIYVWDANAISWTKLTLNRSYYLIDDLTGQHLKVSPNAFVGLNSIASAPGAWVTSFSTQDVVTGELQVSTIHESAGSGSNLASYGHASLYSGNSLLLVPNQNASQALSVLNLRSDGSSDVVMQDLISGNAQIWHLGANSEIFVSSTLLKP